MTALGVPILADFFGGWELLLLAATFLILFLAWQLPDLMRAMKLGLRLEEPSSPKARSRFDELALWIAQGFDVGRMPFAPGTFGSLVGLLWFAILLALGTPALFFLQSGHRLDFLDLVLW